jgi:hypothetical protein
MPFSPCGMIMDYLRSGYVARVRWQQGGTGEANIRWLPAKAGAQIFPHRTAFSSSVWQPDLYPNLGVGEINRFRTWSPNVPSVLAGDHFDGDASWFLTGVPADHWNDPAVNCGLGAVSIGVAALLGMTVHLADLPVVGIRPDCLLGITASVDVFVVPGVLPDCALGMTVSVLVF